MTLDLFSLSGKTALVTGGSQGIGLMISRGLVQAGAKVFVSSRKADVCEAAATELSEFGVCEPLPADVSSQAGITALVGDPPTANRHTRDPGQQCRHRLGGTPRGVPR